MQNFYARLKKYYKDVGQVLKGKASSASIFPNAGDIGTAREKIYLQFLRNHLPSRCNVFLGGFLFDVRGNESRQLDIIVINDSIPRFRIESDDKSFSPVDGTLGVVSVKSTLDKKELFDSLDLFASIPANQPLDGKVNPLYQIKDYPDWPLKVIYASEGIATSTLLTHIEDYYKNNSHIPLGRRPNFIHVAGQTFIARAKPGMNAYAFNSLEPIPIEEGVFTGHSGDEVDVQAICWVVNGFQDRALAAAQINFVFGDIINQVSGLPSTII